MFFFVYLLLITNFRYCSIISNSIFVKVGVGMLVCAHGNVSAYCAKHDMVIVDSHSGAIEEYSGHIKVLVTDKEMSQAEYFLLKGKMLAQGVELVSVNYTDDTLIADVLAYTSKRRKKYGGRQKFGFYVRGGELKSRTESIRVARKIIEMRDAGFTLKEIREAKGICHPDGRPLSISTIHSIIEDRERYEE